MRKHGKSYSGVIIIGKGLICPEDIIAADIYVPGLSQQEKALELMLLRIIKRGSKSGHSSNRHKIRIL